MDSARIVTGVTKVGKLDNYAEYPSLHRYHKGNIIQSWNSEEART